jgi:ATP-dependent RNA helicase DeaD
MVGMTVLEIMIVLAIIGGGAILVRSGFRMISKADLVENSTELAAAALALLRKKAPASPAREAPAAHGGRSAPAYVRLFITLGEKDGIGKKDLVGAIIGESGIEGAQIGKIETKELHSLVEVEESVAEKVMRALNGTTIRGRAVRVDYDRAKRGAGPARAGRGPGPKSRPAR